MIAMIGYMGSGKSTVASQLEKSLGLRSIDLDDYIEASVGKSIVDIFEQYGAYHFRSLERRCMLDVFRSEQYHIVALGGGTPCFYDNIDYIKKYAKAIYLSCDTEVLIDRIYSNAANRPLIKGKSKEELAAYVYSSLSERQKYYEKADLIIHNKDIESTISQIKVYYEDIHQDRR